MKSQRSMKKRTIFINGRFLTQSLTGVQRYALQITQTIDSMIEDHSHLQSYDWHLVVPPNAMNHISLKRIVPVIVGAYGGHAWEQTLLPWAARGGVLVNLGNSAPIAHCNSVTVVHDAAVFRTPKNFSWWYAAFHRLMTRAIGIISNVGTVSVFSRSELAKLLHIDEGNIFIAGNGVDHMIQTLSDENILEKLGIRKGHFFLFIGTQARNKNLRLLVDAFSQSSIDAKLVLVGNISKGIFAEFKFAKNDRIISTGRLPDEQIKGLLRSATAFVFPSHYEGFGIPLLEAMVNKCPVLASDIPTNREVCGDYARYFDPNNPHELAEQLNDELIKRTNPAVLDQAYSRALTFNWRTSALAVIGAAEKLISKRT